MSKDLKYWQKRGGQIEWRLAAQKAIVRQMEKDLSECDEQIKVLSQNPIPTNPHADGEG